MLLGLQVTDSSDVKLEEEGENLTLLTAYFFHSLIRIFKSIKASLYQTLKTEQSEEVKVGYTNQKFPEN